MEQGDYVPCPEPPKPFVDIIEDGFGFITKEDGTREIVRRYTFTNQDNLSVQVISYGATITSIKCPDKNGNVDDVVLGFDNLDGYLSPSNPYMGATIGRVANRIAKGHFKIGEYDYQLSTNIGQHHLHGGFKGFDKVNWKSEIQEKKVVMTYMSKDGEEGYPGEVLTCLLFEMTTTSDFIIEMKATSSKPTPINLTSHSYFNLAGHAKGAGGLYQHLVSINADKYCHTDEDFIPTGMLKNVVNTLWDLRIAKKLAGVLNHVPYGGYDQNMCIHKTSSECMSFIARVYHPDTGRSLEVYSNQPGVQFYTANHFPTRPSALGPVDGIEMDVREESCLVQRCPYCNQLIKDPDFENQKEENLCSGEEGSENNEQEIFRLIGKGGVEYFKHAAFCLMTQKFPDSVHRKNFPNSILRPGEVYHHIVKYKFGIFVETIPEPEEEEPVTESESEDEDEVHAGEEVEEDDLLSTKLEENGR
ncbi:hypothetical protein RUM44_004261 [Polyplax serrata]|uniref:Galactose mutarotase n=1 Tax=Polyplax serrata TaxID=468196 RepID=A0ABR1B2B9_POLSC